MSWRAVGACFPVVHIVVAIRTISLGGSVNAVHEEEGKERGKDGGGMGK